MKAERRVECVVSCFLKVHRIDLHPENNPVFSKHNQIPSILQAVEVWHLQTLHQLPPLIALWIMTPSVIPAGDNGSH